MARVTLANRPPPSPKPGNLPAPCSPTRAPAGGAEDHQRQTDGRRPRPVPPSSTNGRRSCPGRRDRQQGPARSTAWTSSCGPRRMPASSRWLCQRFGRLLHQEPGVHTMRTGIRIPVTNEIVQDLRISSPSPASAAGRPRPTAPRRRPSRKRWEELKSVTGDFRGLLRE